MIYDDILTSADGPVLTITINRPDAGNKFRQQTCLELFDALQKFRPDRDRAAPGTAESAGGGGADRMMTLIAFQRLGRAACDGAIETAAAALQSHGGYGYLVEYPAERHLRDAVSLQAAVDTWGAATAAAAAVAGLDNDATLWQETS